LVRETRGGALNDATYGQRMSGTGAYADLLARRFERAARQLKLQDRPQLDCSLFAPPVDTRAKGFAEAQMSLF
jgi:hypothetical protein